MKKIVFSVFVLASMATPAWAQTPPAAPAPPPPSIEIGGLADLYYDYYSTKPSGDATFRNFDTRHNQFALSMAQVWLAKAPTADSRIGFKFKLNFGPASSNFIHAAEPGGSPYQNIQEAYISYLAPAGRGLQVDAGVFVTPAGAEVIEAKDNINYSRGLLFALAIPYYHSGVRVTYAASDKISIMGGLTNGWNNIVDNNSGKTLLGSVTFKPSARYSVTGNYLLGPEQKGDSDNFRHLVDVIGTLAVTPRITITANWDYGREATGPDTSVKWTGLAGYAKIQVSPTVSFSPRFELYDDPDGFTTGTVQTLKEITGTFEIKAADNLAWRIELRNDSSDVKPFRDEAGNPKGSQTSIGFGLLFSFSAKVQ